MGVSLKRIRAIAQGIFFVFVGGGLLVFGALFASELLWDVMRGKPHELALIIAIAMTACGGIAILGGIRIALGRDRRVPK